MLIALIAAPIVAAARTEYFTEDEIDMIRDAQELDLRIPVYFQLAERRLIFLGLMEKSAEQIKKEQKELQKRKKKEKTSLDTGATAKKPPVDDTSYLEDFTRAELLHGYTEALEEITNNIDDAYSRKLDVRGSLDDLSEFVHKTLPLLEKFTPKTAAERVAFEEAVEKARQTQADTDQALKIVPKTEKKRK